MGQRVYTPAVGRFLQTEPVTGGSANAYDYVNQDPINATDLMGTMGGAPTCAADRYTPVCRRIIENLGREREFGMLDDVYRTIAGWIRPIRWGRVAWGFWHLYEAYDVFGAAFVITLGCAAADIGTAGATTILW
jgi:hypothetical protein